MQKLSLKVSKDVVEIVRSFRNKMTTKYHRYASWEFCYGLAQCMHDRKKELSDDDYDYMALNLSFYLASWGMYRGSFLLQKSYKVNVNIVKMILNNDSLWIEGIPSSEVYFKLRNSLNETYGFSENEEGITDTLLTKIVLGMTGKVIAYDRYCKKSLKYLDVSDNFYSSRIRSWDEVTKSVLPIFNEILENARPIAKYNKYVFDNGRYIMTDYEIEYPILKYLDMFLFTLGMILESLNSLVLGDNKQKEAAKKILKELFVNGVSYNNFFIIDYLTNGLETKTDVITIVW